MFAGILGAAVEGQLDSSDDHSGDGAGQRVGGHRGGHVQLRRVLVITEMATMMVTKKGAIAANEGAKKGEMATKMGPKGKSPSMAVMKTIWTMQIETPIGTRERMMKLIDERRV